MKREKTKKREDIARFLRRAALSRNHILKIDSTKKITRKLQGTATKTVSCCTIIFHLHIKNMPKPFKSEDVGRRYNRSKTSQSDTDRDCCKDDGPSKF